MVPSLLEQYLVSMHRLLRVAVLLGKDLSPLLLIESISLRVLRSLLLLGGGSDVSSAVVEGSVGATGSADLFCTLFTTLPGVDLMCCFSTPMISTLPSWRTRSWTPSSRASRAARRMSDHMRSPIRPRFAVGGVRSAAASRFAVAIVPRVQHAESSGSLF